MTAVVPEDERARRLVDAETMAVELFDETGRRGLIEAGATEREVSDRIRDLGAELFGTDKHWHKRVVRAGPNTLQPFVENPPDRVIEADDIVFCDFGPIFQEWEADVGRTYVLGDDPAKHALCAALPHVFDAGRAHFEAHPGISGEELYRHVCGLAEQWGYSFGNAHSGHLVGEFPHELIDGERIESYITPGSTHPMRRTDPSGRTCHWILEIHLVDRDRQIGGFYEQLLTLSR